MTDEKHLQEYALIAVFFIATLAIVGLVALVVGQFGAIDTSTSNTGGQAAYMGPPVDYCTICHDSCDNVATTVVSNYCDTCLGKCSTTDKKNPKK